MNIIVFVQIGKLFVRLVRQRQLHRLAGFDFQRTRGGVGVELQQRLVGALPQRRPLDPPQPRDAAHAQVIENGEVRLKDGKPEARYLLLPVDEAELDDVKNSFESQRGLNPMNEIRKQIVGGQASFAQLARQHSEDGSGSRGGGSATNADKLALEAKREVLKEMASSLTQGSEKYKEAYDAGARHRVAVIPFREVMGERARLTLYLLMGAAAFVMIISAANVANLTLMRAVRREHELGVRAAELDLPTRSLRLDDGRRDHG